MRKISDLDLAEHTMALNLPSEMFKVIVSKLEPQTASLNSTETFQLKFAFGAVCTKSLDLQTL